VENFEMYEMKLIIDCHTCGECL